MRATLLLLLASMAAGQLDCPFECFHDSICEAGEADFSDHPTKKNGNVLDIHVETQRNGKHCACHPGYTGLFCKKKYEDCADADHKCYHGGKCLLGLADIYGNDQLYCDCSEAIDEHGVKYVGKYCEIAKAETCDNEGNVFCVNGGWCKSNYQNYPRRPCHCGTDYDGPHCEFENGSIPDCTMQCNNGGVCRLGIHGVSPSSEEFLYDFFEKHDNYQYCECSVGFKGTNCEVASSKCGAHHCFHGGECVTVRENGSNKHHCDCSRAATKDGSYAGQYCQYEAENFCDKMATENGQLFCVNGGVCHQRGSHLGCDCPDGYHGPICEFKDPDPTAPPEPEVQAEIEEYEACSLQCQNDGQCRNGVKDTSFLNKFGAEVTHLNQSHDENFEHCVCPEGFVGLTCEHRVESCPGGQHACFHGARCVDDGSGASCDCQPGFTALDKLAGKFCERQSTTLCTKASASGTASFAFCVNNGECVDVIEEDNQEHSGCSCSEQFYGPHCEFLKNDADQGHPTDEPIVDDEPDDADHPINDPNNFPQEYIPEDQPEIKVAVDTTSNEDPNEPSSSSMGAGAFAGIAAAAAVLSIAAALMLFKQNQKRKARQIEAALRNADSSPLHEDALTPYQDEEPPQQRRKQKYRDFLAEYDIPDMDDDYVRPSNSYHDKVFENVDMI